MIDLLLTAMDGELRMHTETLGGTNIEAIATHIVSTYNLSPLDARFCICALINRHEERLKYQWRN